MAPKDRWYWILSYLYTRQIRSQNVVTVDTLDAFFVLDYAAHTGAATFETPDGRVSCAMLGRDLSRLVKDRALEFESAPVPVRLQDKGFPARTRVYNLTRKGSERVEVEAAQRGDTMEALIGKARVHKGDQVVVTPEPKDFYFGPRAYIWSPSEPGHPHVVVVATSEDDALLVVQRTLRRRANLPALHPLRIDGASVAQFPAGWTVYAADVNHVVLLQS